MLAFFVFSAILYTLKQQHAVNTMQKQKQIKYKNVARYLQTAATQVQLALYLYNNTKNAQRSAAYNTFATNNAQAITAKYAHIVANAQQVNALIIAQTLHSSSLYLNANANLQYILYAYKLMQA